MYDSHTIWFSLQGAHTFKITVALVISGGSSERIESRGKELLGEPWEVASWMVRGGNECCENEALAVTE